jgi:hypothetical protein
MDHLVPANVGLLDVGNQNRSFWMLSGDDVVEGFPLAESQTKSKTNIFAFGYESGTRVSVGASLKGRIWSYQVAQTLKHWVDWCHVVGQKLTDDTISLEEVQKNFIRPVRVKIRPELVPLAIEWPVETLCNFTEVVKLNHNELSWPIVDCGLELRAHSETGPIEIRVVTPYWTLDYDIEIDEEGFRIVPCGPDADVVGTRSVNTLMEYFSKFGVRLLFEKEAILTSRGMFHQIDRALPSYPTDLLLNLDWTGVNLAIESQGEQRRADSVQAYMIQEVCAHPWDVVLDDDGTNEVADIVCLKIEAEFLIVHLIHCKYVTGGVPRSRVTDLYEVCGQAMKSVHWKRQPMAMVENLIRRETNRRSSGKRSGLMVGIDYDLMEIQDKSRYLKPMFTIAIAQPGITKAGVSGSQLELLASTDAYVKIKTGGSFEVYTSH